MSIRIFAPFLGLILMGGMLWQCTASRKTQSDSDADLQRLLHYMVGNFSSQLQHQRDSDYYDIRLHIVPIWEKDQPNHWLYVEQATAAAESKPYRQRVYKVESDGVGGFKSIVYTLPNPSDWAGKYKTPKAFDALKPADLSLRDGCTVHLKKEKDGSFSGATMGNGCESNLRGAKYASSKVTITKTMLKSWDQGFNDKGEQVWGATKGGYDFVKQ